MPRIRLDPAKKLMIAMTRAAVGGRVNFLTIKFKDGESLRVRVIDESVYEIPEPRTEEDVESVGVPFEQ
jgi:hypothetical protein